MARSNGDIVLRNTHFRNQLCPFAERWKLVAKSSDFHLTPIRAHRAHRAHFSNSKYSKKPDILSEKRESGMALKKREFTPESGNVDTYDQPTHKCFVLKLKHAGHTTITRFNCTFVLETSQSLQETDNHPYLQFDITKAPSYRDVYELKHLTII